MAILFLAFLLDFIWVVKGNVPLIVDELKQINKKLDSFVEWTGTNEPIR